MDELSRPAGLPPSPTVGEQKARAKRDAAIGEFFESLAKVADKALGVLDLVIEQVEQDRAHDAARREAAMERARSSRA